MEDHHYPDMQAVNKKAADGSQGGHRSELSISHYQSIVDRAHKEIEGVRSVYTWLVGVLGFVVIISLLLLGFLSSKMIHAMHAEVESKMSQLDHRVETRIEKQLAEQEIQHVVEQKTKEQIDRVVSPLLHQQLEGKIKPEIHAAEASLRVFQEQLAIASSTLEKIKVGLDFSMTVLAAEQDDRQAFNQLRAWADDSSFPFSAAALEAWVKIRWSYGGHAAPAVLAVNWPEGFDHAQLNLADLLSVYGKLPSRLKAGMIHYIWSRTDLPKQDKMQFLADVFRHDKSLQAANTAARFFAEEARLTLEPFDHQPLEKWWEENKDYLHYPP